MNGAEQVNAINTLRARLRARRLALGLTRVELAEKADTTWQMVGHVEAGRRNPSIGLLARWAHALGLKVELPVDETIGEVTL